MASSVLMLALLIAVGLALVVAVGLVLWLLLRKPPQPRGFEVQTRPDSNP